MLFKKKFVSIISVSKNHYYLAGCTETIGHRLPMITLNKQNGDIRTAFTQKRELETRISITTGELSEKSY